MVSTMLGCLVRPCKRSETELEAAQRGVKGGGLGDVAN